MLGANARMYSVTPASSAGWAAIFAWLADRTGIELDIIDHPPPAPLVKLWARPGLGCVLMCGWPFAITETLPLLLAAPVPSPARYRGRPEYWSDLVVRADSRFARLEDTFGGTVGWTVADSHSGFNMLRHHLLQYRQRNDRRLFARSVGGLVNPLGALTAVAEGRVDIAPIDSICHDLFRSAGHPVTRQVRILDRTASSPIPVLVASPDVDEAQARILSEALINAHHDPILTPHFAATQITHFVRPAIEDYARGKMLDDAARNAGYPVPA